MEKKEKEIKKAVKAYFIKNSKGKGGGGGERKPHKKTQQRTNKNKKSGKRGWVGRQSEGLGGVVWVYKTGLK